MKETFDNTKETFDNTVERAIPRPASGKPGRIRFWLKATAFLAGCGLLFFWVQDAYARAKADIRISGSMAPEAAPERELECFTVLICEMPQ